MVITITEVEKVNSNKLRLLVQGIYTYTYLCNNNINTPEQLIPCVCKWVENLRSACKYNILDIHMLNQAQDIREREYIFIYKITLIRDNNEWDEYEDWCDGANTNDFIEKDK
jgi:hypothetical protein